MIERLLHDLTDCDDIEDYQIGEFLGGLSANHPEAVRYPP
jgi:hypothetical protein